MNELQKAVTMTFAGGQYRSLIHEPNIMRALEQVDDRMYVFLMTELSTDDGCSEINEAIGRLEQAQADITFALSALYRQRRLKETKAEQKRAA